MSTVRHFLDAIKVEHTVFALPFAYLGMVLAARGWPGWHAAIWITVAMVAARTTAMAANRLIDRRIDARNPRTAGRHLPRGLLKPRDLAVAARAVYTLLQRLDCARPEAMTKTEFVYRDASRD